MKQYSELLRDPRWQKKRLEIMQRDDFACIECGDSESTLNVHHCYYQKGRMPWDYPDKSLITLCEPCHGLEADAFAMKVYLSDALSAIGCREGHFRGLARSVENSRLQADIDTVIGALCCALGDSDMQSKMIEMYCAILDSVRGLNG